MSPPQAFNPRKFSLYSPKFGTTPSAKVIGVAKGPLYWLISFEINLLPP